MTAARALVVENDPTDDVRRLGDWLVAAGLELSVVRPHAGDALPDNLEGYVALVVLGGAQDAYGRPDGTGAPWFAALESLLRHAVATRVPTLGICLGAQLLAQAMGGMVERSPVRARIGPALVARRDAAERDPLFAELPLSPDVLTWNRDEITELPGGAVLLAAGLRQPHQAFRIGDRAWGLQFHIECDTDMIAAWVAEDLEKHGVEPHGLDHGADLEQHAEGERAEPLGWEPDELIAAVDAVMPDLAEVWQPFAARFAALALGTLDTGVHRQLPLLG